jgi:hypothetical protein
MSNKNAIYIFDVGKYGKIHEPLVKAKGWDYILFTDNIEFKSDIWKIYPLHDKFLELKDPKRIAMSHMIGFYELEPFKEHSYENIISIPSDTLIKKDLNDFIKEYNLDNNESDAAFLKHPERNCAYREALIIKEVKLDHAEVVDKVIKKYEDSGYPRWNGLFATGLILRKNNENCRKMFKVWFDEYIDGSRRDQLSVNYAVWKSKKIGNNIRINVLPWSAFGNNNYFKYVWHYNAKDRTVK